MEFFTRYGKGPDPAPAVDFSDKKIKGNVSMTNQADKEFADVNKIIARFDKTGNILDLAGVSRAPVYGDFTGVGDYHTMLASLRRADEAFAVLSSEIRKRFNNDVANLIAFLDDSKNDEEAVKLGLKDASVLLTAYADDGKTRISPAERKALDDKKAADAAASAAGAGTGTGAPKA